MFSQDRKFFRFRFHVGIIPLLAFLLLVSLAEPATAGNECAEITKTLQKSPNVDRLTNDRPDKLTGILSCLREEEDRNEIAKVLQNVIEKIPILIEKVKPLATKEGLLLLSVFLLYSSTELYIQAKNLDIDYRKHQQQFDSLTEELKIIKDFIDTDILPQVKNGSIAKSDMPGKIEKLIEMMKDFGDVISELVQAIEKDIKQSSTDSMWSIFYIVVAFGVSAYSFQFTGIRWVIFVVCSFCFATVALCYYSNIFFGETFETLNLMWHDTAKMRTEINKYNTIFKIVKIKENIY